MRPHGEKRLFGPGLGIASMQRIVERCNGELLFKVKGDPVITCRVNLPT